jgi:hypothetical protein
VFLFASVSNLYHMCSSAIALICRDEKVVISLPVTYLPAVLTRDRWLTVLSFAGSVRRRTRRRMRRQPRCQLARIVTAILVIINSLPIEVTRMYGIVDITSVSGKVSVAQSTSASSECDSKIAGAIMINALERVCSHIIFYF